MLVRKVEQFILILIFELPAVIGFTPTLHLSVPNMDEPHKLSLMAMLVMFAPKGGKPCDGNKEPEKGEKFPYN
jgi:hypothetical protein